MTHLLGDRATSAVWCSVVGILVVYAPGGVPSDH